MNPLQVETADKTKEDFFKTALNEETEVNSLLAYYRERISNFERERFEWLSRFEQVKLSQEQKHKLEWDVRRSKDEIADLQRALSDARLKLFEEKQISLKLSAENEQLLERADCDGRKIGELMNVCNPVEQKIIFKKNQKPSIMTKFVNNDLNIDYHKKGKQATSNLSKNNRRVDSLVSDPVPKTLYKTLVMPYREDGEVDEDGSFRNTHDLGDNENEQFGFSGNSKYESEEKRVLRCHLNSLRDELETREREIQLERQDLNRRMNEILSKNKKLEKLNIELNKEFFAQRINFEQTEHKLQQENELLRLKNVSLANQLGSVSTSAELENKITKDLLEKRSTEYAQKFKNKARRKEEKLVQIKDQYKKVQAVYVEKIADLEKDMRELKKR